MTNPLTPAMRVTLCEAARAAAKNAYAPYSAFRVGAAVFAGATIYSGANVENASYGLSLCAERNALAHATASGERVILAIAVACIDADRAGKGIQELMPCGACRQWMVELAREAEILVCGVDRVFRVADLLPLAFDLGSTTRA